MRDAEIRKVIMQKSPKKDRRRGEMPCFFRLLYDASSLVFGQYLLSQITKWTGLIS